MLTRVISIHVMVFSISSAIAAGLLCSLKDFSAPFWLWVILDIFWCSQPTEWDKGEDFADFHYENCNKNTVIKKKQLKAFVALHILAPTIIHNTILMNGSLKNGSWEWEFDDGIWSFRIPWNSWTLGNTSEAGLAGELSSSFIDQEVLIIRFTKRSFERHLSHNTCIQRRVLPTSRRIWRLFREIQVPTKSKCHEKCSERCNEKVLQRRCSNY